MSLPNFQPRDPILICLAEIEPKKVDWLWEPYLAKGTVALLSGDPGSGKTFVSLAIAASLSKGIIPSTGESCEPVNTVYLSHENSAEYVTRPRFDALGGDPTRLFLLPGKSVSLTDTSDLSDAIDEARAGLLIVDPIQSYLGADVDLHRSNETRPVLDGLVFIADNFGCCILLVRHLAKSSGGRAIHRGLGSIDLTATARTELLAGTSAHDPNNRALVQIKNNLGPYGDSLGYSIGEDGFAWTGKSNLTANDLLSSDNGTERQSSFDGALEFLKAQLASGEKFQAKLVETAKGIYHERTLQRAAKELGVERRRDGEGGPWIWYLP
jgi:RecA-family ATPase